MSRNTDSTQSQSNEETGHDDYVIGSLKKRYFDILPKEKYPHTPEITKEADNIEKAIRDLQKKRPVS